jgi:hypothetical protein
MAKHSAAGINLSAFGIERRPMLAIAKEEGEGVVSVKLGPMASFGGKIKLMDPLDDLFARWRKDLLELPRPIAVDVPLDLQGLGARSDSRFIWELTHRPMDFAFYQDAPLTDRIGIFNVRFLELMGRSQFNAGKDFIEVSPLACTEFFDFRGIYKGGRAHQGKGGAWKADDSTVSADRAFTKIAHELGFNIENTAEGKLDSGDFDAVMCALTALALAKGVHTVSGGELKNVIAERVARRMNMEPDAFAKLEAPRACHALAQPYWQAVLITRVG